jgi:glycine/D-amino acid oxidase-like deaminating enzyme
MLGIQAAQAFGTPSPEDDMSIYDQHYDVLVAGGGIAGTMAAIAAAREGARTLLVERYAALGGMGTLGLVQPITTWGIRGHYNCGGTGKRILSGLADKAAGAATAMNHYGPTCDAEYLKFALEQQALAAGVELLYHTWLRDVEMESGAIRSVWAFSKQGDFSLRAKVVVDATGDADLVAAAGAPFELGGQGVTLMFVVAGIDQERCPERKEIGAIYTEHKVGYRGLALFWHPRPDAAYFNVTEVEHVDVLDAADLTRATIACRQEAWRILDVVRQHIPGFEHAYIAETAAALGVRESRRLQGVHVLTGEEACAGADFADTIARASCPVDIHGSAEGGKGVYHGLKQSYGIPYRSLIADGFPNLLVAGRPISADHAAHSSLRRMAPGFAIGEAAGIAAAMAANKDGNVHAVSVPDLQASLRGYDGILDPE